MISQQMSREQVLVWLGNKYNLAAILNGTVSGQTQEWPMMQVELIALVSEHAALRAETELLRQRDKEREEIFSALRDCRDDPHHAIGIADKVIGEKLFVIAYLTAQLAAIKDS